MLTFENIFEVAKQMPKAMIALEFARCNIRYKNKKYTRTLGT